MKLFICTPVFNAEKTLERTIKSVVSLQGNNPIHYHIQDGASTDKTIEIIKKWELELLNNKRIEFSYSSSNDLGMYDAIVKSFDHPSAHSADWLTWINADDYLLPRSALIVEAVDSVSERKISWVSGKPAMLNLKGDLIVSSRPVTAEILKEGLADGVHWEFLQQEGTFFRSELWFQSVDIEKFRSFKLAGDWFLWHQLAHSAELYLIAESLGVFCQMENQLSMQSDRYLSEVDSIVPSSIRNDSLTKMRGAKSRANFLYPTSLGVFLRTDSIYGHYIYRRDKLQ